MERAVFAFYLGDNADGELAIGGYNPDKMNDPNAIHWAPLANPAYWLIAMDKVSFGDAVVTTARTGVIMDTGTSLIYGPQTQVEPMVQSIKGAKYYAQLGLYNIPCESDIPSLQFQIGGEAYVVPGDALKIKDDSGNYCFFSVAIMKFAADSEIDTTDEVLEERVVGEIRTIAGVVSPIPEEFQHNTWLMGDVFLRRQYSIFDYENERFGLAELKDERKE